MFKSSLTFSLKIATTTALLLTLVPSSAKAAIIGYNDLSPGDIEFDSFINDDYNFWYNDVQRSTDIRGFNEAQKVTLDRAIPIQSLNKWEIIDDLSYIAPDTVVDSHLLYLTKPLDAPRGLLRAEATIKFSGKIIGLIGDPILFSSLKDYSFDYNELFAPNATHLPGRQGWTLEGESGRLPLDKVEFVDESMTSIKLSWQTYNSIDPLRVLTLSPTESHKSVPEPLTLLGAGSAIVMGGLFKSKLKNHSKNV